MSEWKRYKLNEIASLSNGINFDKSAYTSGVKLIGVADFKDRVYPDYGSLQEVDSKVVRNGDYLEKGDIVFVRSNGNKELVGRCMMIDRDIPVTFSGFCIKLHLIDKNKFEPAYFNYLFRTREFKKVMTGTAVGANIQNLSQSRLGNCEINVPNIETQRELAIIISRYDSLIENYQKQIKLLEESAQRLYKEWFIDFRFPGHENTKIVDGVPKGWEKKPFGSIIGYEIGGGWGADAKSSNEIIPAYVIRGTDIRDLNIGVWNELPYRFHQESNYRARQLMHNDIVFEVSGGSKNEGVAKTYLVQQELLDKLGNQVICASFCKLIRLKDSSIAYYVFDTLKEWRASGITTQYDKRSASSIVNYRWKDFLSQQEITVPNEIVLRDYIKKSELIHSSIIKISSQIRHLTEARDRLLPKLMSGEIKL